MKQKITLTNYRAFDLYQALSTKMDCKGVLGWKIFDNIITLESNLEAFVRIRNDLVEKHGREDPDTGVPIIEARSAGFTAFKRELDPIGNEEIKIELHLIDRLDIECGTALSVADCLLLRPLIKCDDPIGSEDE